MKKIFLTPVMLLLLIFAEPALACSQEKIGEVTGSACSVKELMNLEKQKNANANVNQDSKRERELRPVRLVPQAPTKDSDKCLFGMCLMKSLLEK